MLPTPPSLSPSDGVDVAPDRPMNRRLNGGTIGTASLSPNALAQYLLDTWDQGDTLAQALEGDEGIIVQVGQRSGGFFSDEPQSALTLALEPLSDGLAVAAAARCSDRRDHAVTTTARRRDGGDDPAARHPLPVLWHRERARGRALPGVWDIPAGTRLPTLWGVQSRNRQLLHALRQHPERHTYCRRVKSDSMEWQWVCSASSYRR
jgi:hypothetical protein